MHAGPSKTDRITVEGSDKTWSTGEGNSKPLQYSCHENPMNRMKSQEDMKLEDAPPRLVGVQHVAGEEQRNSSRRNEQVESKRKRRPVVGVSGGELKSDAVKNSIE